MFLNGTAQRSRRKIAIEKSRCSAASVKLVPQGKATCHLLNDKLAWCVYIPKKAVCHLIDDKLDWGQEREILVGFEVVWVGWGAWFCGLALGGFGI